jgi:hypothetical protein
MDYRITRREVLHNLIRFKDNLLELRATEGNELKKGNERHYKALLNRKTGDIRFTKKISAIEHHISRSGPKKESVEDWSEILILVHQKSPFDAAQFEFVDSRRKPLKPSELESLAWRIASETLEVLNQKGESVKGKQGDLLPEEAVLKDLSQIHLSPHTEGIEDLPGWMGSMSRMDAEKTLEKKVIGTYLLRQGDEITVSIAFHFSKENLLSIRPYLLTVVEAGDKISDILLLETAKGWTLYQDDPNFKDEQLYHFHPSAKALLQALHSIARFPLS